MSILVLALNPSIDAEWRVADVLWEEKNNVSSERRWAGGKGINVARWLKHLGGPAQLLLPLGGRTGAELAGYLRGEKIPARVIRLREATRVNVIVTTKAGRQMRFNAPGPKLAHLEWGRVAAAVAQNLHALARPARSIGLACPASVPSVPSVLLVLSGSLPRGVPLTAYAQLIRLAHRHGVRTLLDCDGPAFAAAVPARPFLVKPNEHELAQWWRQPLRSEAELVRAARALSEQTRGWVLVSRGAKRSLHLNGTEGFRRFAEPPRAKPRNTVGAGDARRTAGGMVALWFGHRHRRDPAAPRPIARRRVSLRSADRRVRAFQKRRPATRGLSGPRSEDCASRTSAGICLHCHSARSRVVARDSIYENILVLHRFMFSASASLPPKNSRLRRFHRAVPNFGTGE